MSDVVKVYLVTPTAVYDHGTAGVFSTREAAIAHATALLDSSDHHHDLRVDELVLDAEMWPDLLGHPDHRRSWKTGQVIVSDVTNMP